MTSHSPCELSGSLWLSLVTVRALVGLMYDLWTQLIFVYVDMLCCGRKKESLEAQSAAHGRPISGSGIGYGLTGTGQSAGTSADMSTLGSSRTSAVGNRHISPWYDDRSWTRSASGAVSRRGTPWTTSFTGNSSLAASGANGPVQMGIRSIETYADYTIIETVEIVKRPGQTLGFYIREGNGIDRTDGVFISRIAPCSIVEKNGLLRVGEEIIAVDGVNITHMSLDDVVILMSLPRRLILTVKTHKTCCSKNLSCPALLATPTAPAPDQGLMVSGTASAAGWDGKDGTMERSRGGVPDRRVEHQRHWSTASVVDLTDNYAADDHQQNRHQKQQHHHHQVKVDDTRQDYVEHGGNIVSVRQPDVRQFMPFDVHQQQQQQLLHQENLTASMRRRQQQNIGSWDRRIIPSTAQQGASYDEYDYGARRTLRYPLDYSSDTEAPVIGQLLPAEWRRHPSKQGTGSGVVKVEVETTSFEPEWPPTLNGKRQRRSSGTAASGMMTSYDNGFPAELDDTGAAKRHISDSDLNGNGARVEDDDYVSGLVSLYKRSSGAGAAAGAATAAAAASSTGASSYGRSAGDKSSSLPEIENGNNGSTKSDELRHWLRKLDKLSLELQEFNHRNGGSELPASQNPGVTAAEPSTFTSHRDDIVTREVGRSRRRINDVTTARQRAPSAPETYTAEEYRTWSRDRVRGRSPSTAGGGRRRKSAETTSGERRHLSAADAAPTLPTSGSLADRRLGSVRPAVSRPRPQPTSGYFRDSAPSRQEPEVRPEIQQRPRPPPTAYSRTPLNKQPLRIRTEEFRPYRTPPVSVASASDRRSRPSDNPPSGGGGIDGRLLVHVYCGHGLRSSPTVLRDLYCVVAVDSLNQARTAVQSGAVNFDWDEQFDIDVLAAKVVSFNVYSWTPGTKQTLYFTGRVDLVNYRNSQPQTAPSTSTGTRSAKFTDNGPRQRLALRLEPSGVLYVELAHLDLSIAYCRPPAPTVVASVAVFGVGLEALVAREKGTMAASGARGVSRDVPAVVRRCVREVERRGLDAVGVYRLCCATRRKKQLKAELEADVIGVVLSAEHVPDINVVTCVLKDFFIEMPEPLFTNGLYQLLLDAMTVQLTDDPQGNAHMMYGIIDCLPRVNQATLTFMLDHFKRVARKSDVNKMTSSALARVFGPLFVCPPYRLVRHVPVDLQRHADLLGYVIDIWPPTSSAPEPSATAAAAAAYR